MPSTEGRPQTKPSRRPNGSSTPSPATTAVPASTTSSNRPTSSKPIPRGGARKSAASSRRLQIETHAADPQALAVRAESTVARDRQCTRRAGGGKPHRRDALAPGAAPAPRFGRPRLVERDDGAADVAGVEVDGGDVVQRDLPHDADAERGEPLASGLEVLGLEDDHVAAVAAALLEEAAGGRA